MKCNLVFLFLLSSWSSLALKLELFSKPTLKNLIMIINKFLIVTFYLSQCNDNRIEDWKGISELSGIQTLETVYLERNPIHSKDASGYRRKAIMALPKIKQLDATLTGH